MQGKDIKWEIERIVKWRSYRKNGKRHHEALLKWSGFGDECNTWEPAHNLPKGVKPGDTKVPGGEGGSAGGGQALSAWHRRRQTSSTATRAGQEGKDATGVERVMAAR